MLPLLDFRNDIAALSDGELDRQRRDFRRMNGKLTWHGGLNGGLKLLFDIIKTNPGIRAKDASELLGNLPVSTIEKQIRELTDKGLIERRGSKKSGGYYVVEFK